MRNGGGPPGKFGGPVARLGACRANALLNPIGQNGWITPGFGEAAAFLRRCGKGRLVKQALKRQSDTVWCERVLG